MGTGTVVVLIIVGVAIIVGGVLFWLRRRWLKEVAEHGWKLLGDDEPSWFARLGCPPFDVGFDRSAKDHVRGQVDGVEFNAFDYRYRFSADGSRESMHPCAVTLSAPIPELYIEPRDSDPSRATPGCVDVPVNGPFRVLARDPAYASAVLTGPVQSLLETAAAQGILVRLAFDNGYLVADDVSKDPSDSMPTITMMVALAKQIPAQVWTERQVTAKQPRFGFTGHDWALTPDDNRWVGEFDGDPFGVGKKKKAEHIIMGSHKQQEFVSFRYEWVTTRTRTVRTGNTTQTRTEEEKHHAYIVAVRVPVALPEFALSRDSLLDGWGDIEFESEQFNDEYTVKSKDKKFAYDVMHPRTMEYLLANVAAKPNLRTDGAWIRSRVDEYDAGSLARQLDVMTDFIAAIPDFVWADRGVKPPQR